ncbi:hypothetical protein HHK36_032409 [Tetracentron sinense]|uniref:Uncharacterized protein n=1 Tax=Tetracentron sinense TaxID=13715 RepID=A0A834Y5J2_TETSI|nr:hypothetical protein HHK36_032409 [Tetracentron sinense]
MLSFTSMGGKVDHSVLDGRGPYTFRINGENYHRIGTLLPSSGQKPKFAQFYVYDTEHEVRNRINVVVEKNSTSQYDVSIVSGLQTMLDNINPYVHVFRMARDALAKDEALNFHIRIIERRDEQQYNRPTSTIEQERLNWVRFNQDKLRSDLYKGLEDAITAGDVNASAVGRRCKGPPDLFITFTCNPRIPTIQQELARIHGQRPEDRLDIVSRDLRTVDCIIYPTFKAACPALGLLDDDTEWHESLTEASLWATGRQLRYMFCSMLMFSELTNPLELWERHWMDLTDDMQYKSRRDTGEPDLSLDIIVQKNMGLNEIEQILNKNGRSLKEFTGMLMPSLENTTVLLNRLIREELSFDADLEKQNFEILHSGLNEEQQNVFQQVVESYIHKNRMDYETFDRIHPYKSSWTIKVRVSRVFDVYEYSNAKGCGKLLKIILIDEKGGEIQATLFNSDVDKFSSILEEESAYFITNVKVVNALTKFQVVSHKYQLNFTNETSIHKIEDACSEISARKYNFKEFKSLRGLLNSEESNIDIIGVIVAVNPSIEVHKKNGSTTVKRDIIVVDTTVTSITLTIWGPLALKYDDELLHAMGNHVVLVATSLLVREFQGDIYLSSTISTLLKFEPSIPEAKRILEWLHVEGGTFLLKSSYNGAYVPGSKFPAIEDRVSIDDLISKSSVCPSQANESNDLDMKLMSCLMKEYWFQIRLTPENHRFITMQGFTVSNIEEYKLTEPEMKLIEKGLGSRKTKRTAMEKDLWVTRTVNEEHLKSLNALLRNSPSLRATEPATLSIPHLVTSLKTFSKATQEAALDSLLLRRRM